MKRTVKQAVLELIIDKYPFVSNWDIATAHPDHKLSGLSRLRQLRLEGVLHYKYEKLDNTYYIYTPLKELKKKLKEMKAQKKA